jgi:nuclear transport factor 2 (NTF2) superfamily protein
VAVDDLRPPFTDETATTKVQAIEDAFNTRDPDRVARACTEDSDWRDRETVVRGPAEIRAFLAGKWERERDYRLSASLWTFGADSIALRFAYESRDAAGRWWRSHGYELWRFDGGGLLALRYATVADAPVDAAQLRIATATG